MTDFALYNLNVFDRINNDGFTLELPQESIDIVNKISEIVGASNYVKTPVFHKKAKNKRIPEEPHIPRPEVERSREEELKREICASLNKLTEVTYSKLLVPIESSVKELKDVLNDDVKFMDDVTKWIFDVTLMARTSSKQYVDILIHLKNIYPEMSDYIKDKVESFMDMFHGIESVNPEEDYEKFCLLNLESEKRKSLSGLIANLIKVNMLKINDLSEILISLCDQLYISCKKPNVKPTCEAISDNLYVLISLLVDEMKDIDDYKLIMDKIKLVKDLTKGEDNPSFTSKVKFKLMDILEIFNK